MQEKKKLDNIVETSFFPVFDSALEVIRQQVDAYLLKPADIRDLVTLLRKGLTEHRGTHVPLPTKESLRSPAGTDQ